MDSYNPFSAITSVKKSQSDILADDIKKQIISGVLPTEKAFPNEPDLCKELGVSRATLREAYKVLEIQGYISRTKHGTFVKDKEDVAIDGNFDASLELAKYNDIIEFLEALEPEAVSLAAQRATPEQLAEIEEYMIQCESQKDVPGAVETLNYQFHLKIRMASQNQLIVSALSASYDQFNQKIIRRLIKGDRDGFLEQCFKEHRQLYQAIKNGNSEEAKKIALKHLRADIKQYKLI